MHPRRWVQLALAVGFWAASMVVAVWGFPGIAGDHGGLPTLLAMLVTLALIVVSSLYVGAVSRGLARWARRFFLLQMTLVAVLLAGSVAQLGFNGVRRNLLLLAVAAQLAGYVALKLDLGTVAPPGAELARRPVSIGVELLYVLAAGGLAVLGMFVGGMRCDEGCWGSGQAGVNWANARDAWQWDAIVAASVVLFFAGILFAAMAGSLWRSRLPLVPYGLQLGASITGFAILATGDTGIELSTAMVWVVGTQGLAITAIVLRRPTARLSTGPQSSG